MSEVRAVEIRAHEIARATGQQHLPTQEQVAVIEAPLAPLLVVAGAGSGKTETMAARVVWLVANRWVRPEEVLGLTFTRKAASELAERVTGRLTRLRESGLWAPDSEGGAPAFGDVPTISTYHSYAGALVREHGVRLGLEAETRLLTEAAAWQFADQVVRSYDGLMDEVAKAPSTVTAAVVDLAGEMAEHLVPIDDVDEQLSLVIGRLETLVKEPGSRRRAVPVEIRETIAALRERRQILPLVRAYAALKRSRDAMDFADQMAVAATLATEHPSVGRLERQRYKAVLLDEFQDTSEAQLTLLSSLFVEPGTPAAVTAVGDPHQSIYGWRGASATTLLRFRTDFGAADTPAVVLPLSTSWRNDTRVLDVANAVAGPLRDESLVPVAPLRARPDAGPGHVAVARVATLEDEAALVVDWVLARRQRPGRRTAAILCRKRSQFDPVVAELERRGVPHEVVGLGGLLHTPEVADLLALLWVAQDPSRGDHLMRLLTGVGVRLGAADLDALGAWSRQVDRDRRSPAHDGSVRDLASQSSDEPSLVEALDALPSPDWRGPEGEWLSSVAHARLAALGAAIRRVRLGAGAPLPEVVAEAEQALGLDVEVLARPGWSTGAARAHLDAFADVVASFSSSADQPTLGGLLGWLDAALAEERGLDLGWIEASDDAVQVMTVHAAKGLEWDVVAVPGLVEATFPAHSAATSKPSPQGWVHSDPRDKAWLTGASGLPHDLRGDRAGLPRFPWDTLEDWDGAAAAYADYVAASGARGLAEERRLAYVAVTRARVDLLLCAHIWGTAQTPRVTSRFLDEIADSGCVQRRVAWHPMPDPLQPCENPRLADDEVLHWPPPAEPMPGWLSEVDPISQHLQEGEAGPPHARPSADAQVLTEELRILLAERAAAGQHVPSVELPLHLSTSSLIQLASDATEFARTLRRPMPTRPTRSARDGQAFHAWVEEHYGRAAFLDPYDLPGAGDDDVVVPFEQLRSNFLASPWAALSPIDVEVPVETVLAGVAIRGRIDAVFADPECDDGFIVVDWKSGRPPVGGAAERRALQLATYRIAWARHRGILLDRVRAAFFHAQTGETVWPDLVGVDTLEELLSLARGQGSAQ